MIPLSKYTNDKGVCLLQKNQSGKSFVQDAPISRLILNGCEAASFDTSVLVRGCSEHFGKFTPLLSVWGECQESYFKNLQVNGLFNIDEHRVGSEPSKKLLQTLWNNETPSGIDIRSEAVLIDGLFAKNLHDVIIIKNHSCSIKRVFADTYSGDFAFINKGDNQITEAMVLNAIKTLPYNKKHRDVVQAATDDVLSNILISDLTYRDGNGPLSQSPDGLIVHTDGKLEKSEFINLDLIADTNEHGFSSVCATDCEIHAFQIASRTGIKIPGISLVDRKGIGESTGNHIDVPMGTWIDPRMNAVDNSILERDESAGMMA